jgi:hypothetical protein
VILVLQVVMHNDGDFMDVILPYMSEKYFSSRLPNVTA